MWMKVDDARRYAGGVGRKLLYRAVASGRLKAARVGAGRSLLFNDRWIDERLTTAATDAATSTRTPDCRLRLVK
jgi:hypothetical protein